MRCGRYVLCHSCAKIRSRSLALDDSMRVVLAHEDNPQLCFAFVSFVVPETEELKPQVDLIRAAARKLRDAKVDGVPFVAGVIWQIELQMGRWRGCRAHLHAIVALRDATRKAQRALMRHWVRMTHGGMDRVARARAFEQQHMTLFRSLRERGEDAKPSLFELGSDAFTVSSYGSKFNELNVDQSLLAFATKGSGKLRDVQGVLRVPDATARTRRIDEFCRMRCYIRRDVCSSDRSWISSCRRWLSKAFAENASHRRHQERWLGGVFRKSKDRDDIHRVNRAAPTIRRRQAL